MKKNAVKRLGYAVTVIGAGRAGSGVSRLLREAGCKIVCVVSRRIGSARALAKEMGAPRATSSLHEISPDSDVILLSAPDTAIESLARELARVQKIRMRGTIVAHLSGTLTRAALQPLETAGARTFAFHPAFPFATRNIAAVRLHDIGWAVECADDEWRFARSFIESLRGVPVRIAPACKGLYHAGCVIASNFLIVLLDAAARAVEQSGISAHDSRALLKSLVDETLRNVWGDPANSIAKNLTGPASRGDRVTIRRHITALQSLPDVQRLYKALTHAAVEIAGKQ